MDQTGAPSSSRRRASPRLSFSTSLNATLSSLGRLDVFRASTAQRAELNFSAHAVAALSAAEAASAALGAAASSGAATATATARMETITRGGGASRDESIAELLATSAVHGAPPRVDASDAAERAAAATTRGALWTAMAHGPRPAAGLLQYADADALSPSGRPVRDSSSGRRRRASSSGGGDDAVGAAAADDASDDDVIFDGAAAANASAAPAIFTSHGWCASNAPWPIEARCG